MDNLHYRLMFDPDKSSRDVPDPDTSIHYPVKFRHPALSSIWVKFAGYLPLQPSNEKFAAA